MSAMVNSQDADAGSAVEDHDENSLSLGAEKIGTKRPRKTKEQASAERADQLAVLQKTDTTGWSAKKLASHTIALQKLTEKVESDLKDAAKKALQRIPSASSAAGDKRAKRDLNRR